MDKKEVKLDGECSVVVACATMAASFRRDRAGYTARVEAGPDASGDELALIDLYADLVGGTVEARGFEWPVSFPEFLAWDGTLYYTRLVPWLDAVLGINPQWANVSEPELGEASAGGGSDSA